MKIAIVSGASKKNDSVRGIGAHSSELFKAFKKGSNKDINIPEVNKDDDLSKYDAVHFTVFRPFFISLPFRKPKNTKFILTIHDMHPLIYPDHFPPGIKGSIRFLINKFLIWKNVDAIITISETSKKDICRFLNVNPDMVNVIYLAPKEIFKKLPSPVTKKVSEKYKLPKRFALYTGDINYNKNIPRLIEACKTAKIPLVIAGKQAIEIEKMDLNHPELSHLKNINFDNVLRLGFVSDEDLCSLYNLATVYVQASLYEGFGLIVLEALKCETPLAVSKTQALVEILGDNVDYVDPMDPKDIAMGILNPNKNIKLPRDYSWKKTASETLDVYAKV